MPRFEYKVNHNHSDFKELKRALKLNNAQIAEISGLTEGSVKTLTKKSSELPAWIKTMIYVFKNFTMVYVKTSESFLSDFSTELIGRNPLKNFLNNAYFPNEALAKKFIRELKLWISNNYSRPDNPNYYTSMSDRSYFTKLSEKEVDNTQTLDFNNFLYFENKLDCKNFNLRLINEIRRLNVLNMGLNRHL